MLLLIYLNSFGYLLKFPLYQLPVEFGRSSHSRQRKDNNQDVCFKKQTEQTKKETLTSSPTATVTASTSSRNDTGRTKNEGPVSQKESSSRSDKQSDVKSDRNTTRADGSEKFPANLSNKDK